MINSFRGDYFFMSNFYESKNQIQFDEYTYENAEAAFQAQKSKSCVYKHLMQFQSAKNAKKEGRKVLLRTDWEEIKDDLMYQIIKAKFEQNPDLKSKLLATGDKFIEEQNTWHDNYWGVCKCIKCQNKIGHNHLGKILMKVRDELK